MGRVVDGNRLSVDSETLAKREAVNDERMMVTLRRGTPARRDSSIITHRVALTLLPAAYCHVSTGYRLLTTDDSRPPRRRRGISLIEVMFAMGILSVGILSLVLLIPLGAYELGEAAKLDQGSTLGRAAFRDLEVRAYLQPKLWVDTQTGMLIAPVLNPDPDPNPAPNALALNPAAGQRLIYYPYLPENCLQFFPPQPGPPVTPPPPLVPSPTTPQLFPQKFPYNYPNATPPLGISMSPMWKDIKTTHTVYPNWPPFPPFAATDAPVVVLDPLMVATALQSLAPTNPATIPSSPSRDWTHLQTFPYQHTYVPGAPLVPRMTLLSWPLPAFIGSPPTASQLPTSPPLPLGVPPLYPAWVEGNWTQPRIMPFAVADRIFRSCDDLLFNNADASHDRPTAIHGGSGTAQYQGSYSWFVTIAPTASELDTNVTTDVASDAVLNPNPGATTNTRQFTASVVVCQNRLLDFPPAVASDARSGEWMVPAIVSGGGLGGGEVTLLATNTNSTNDTNQAAWLAGLHPGQWLMLSGITVFAEIRADTSGNPRYWPKFKTVADWYRIVAVDDGSQLGLNPPMRNVTLHGSDWPQGIQQPSVQFKNLTPQMGVQFVNLNPVSNPILNGNLSICTYATIVEGVVGVFQKTITLDQGSPFTPQQ